MTNLKTNPYIITTDEFGNAVIQNNETGDKFDQAFSLEEAENHILSIMEHRLHEIFKTKLEQRLLFNLTPETFDSICDRVDFALETCEIDDIEVEKIMVDIVTSEIHDLFDIANKKLAKDKDLQKLFGISSISSEYTLQQIVISLTEEEGIFSGGVNLNVDLKMALNEATVLNHYHLLGNLYVYINEYNIYCASVFVNGVDTSGLANS